MCACETCSERVVNIEDPRNAIFFRLSSQGGRAYVSVSGNFSYVFTRKRFVNIVSPSIHRSYDAYLTVHEIGSPISRRYYSIIFLVTACCVAVYIARKCGRRLLHRSRERFSFFNFWQTRNTARSVVLVSPQYRVK